MPQQRSKGMAGMGGRGKNKPKNRQDEATRKRVRKTGGPANLTRPSSRNKDNQGRNQKEWASAKRASTRY